MAAKYFLRAGLVQSGDASHLGGKLVAGPFDLRKWLTAELDYLNIANDDPCCLTSTVNPPAPTMRPMRYNVTAGNMQYYSTEGIWVDISAF